MKYLLCCLLGLVTIVLALDEPPSARFSNRRSMPDANANLPAQVEAIAGKLTLFADFKNPAEEGIPLYLVNRTDHTIPLSEEDGDIYIKLEYQDASGRWVRAQSHGYSDCGNSYGSFWLLPGMHLRMRGYQPAGGQLAKLRYSSYSALDLVSNVGEGCYKPEDVSDATTDRMSLIGVPPGIVEYFATGLLLRGSEPDASSRVAALRMASLMGEIPAIRKDAGKWADELKAAENPSSDQQATLHAVRGILDKNWGERTGYSPLLESCLAALASDSRSSAGFGTLERESLLTWKVIKEIAEMEGSQEIRQRRIHSDPLLWRRIFDLAAVRVKISPEEEKAWITSLLGVPALADQFVADGVFEGLLAEESRLATIAAGALSRRGKWERLAELGSELDPAHQLIVLGALGRSAGYFDGMSYGAFREPPFETGVEEKFWIHVFQSQPVGAAAVLWRSWNYGSHAPRRADCFTPLIRFWERETKRSAEQAQDFELPSSAEDYRHSVNFITAGARKDDIPFLKELFGYRGYQKSMGGMEVAGLEGMREMELRNFGIRSAAAEALKKLGEPVPEDTVFQVKVLTGRAYDGK